MPRPSKPEDTIVPEELYTNPERLLRNLTKLATIVLHQHYSYVREPMLQEDLVQEALVKAIDLIQANTFDSSRSSIRNYIYTGMRNQMQNYMSKRRHEVPVEEVRPLLDSYAESEVEEDLCTPDISINEDLVYSICDPFFALGCYHNPLIEKLRTLGFTGPLTDLEPPDVVDPLVLDALFTEYIWRYAYANR